MLSTDLPRVVTAPRPDPYTAVHKMQRKRLFDLTVAAGTLDVSHDAARTEIAGAVDAMVTEIVHHGHHEERFVHPVLRRHAPEIAAELEDAHGALDAQLDELARTAQRLSSARSADPNELYRALAAFTSTYLVHVEREETGALPVLWKSCQDAELRAIFAEFHSSRSAVTNLASTLAMAPSLNPVEFEQVLTAGLVDTPPTDIADLLATCLTPARLGAITALSHPRTIR